MSLESHRHNSGFYDGSFLPKNSEVLETMSKAWLDEFRRKFHSTVLWIFMFLSDQGWGGETNRERKQNERWWGFAIDKSIADIIIEKIVIVATLNTIFLTCYHHVSGNVDIAGWSVNQARSQAAGDCLVEFHRRCMTELSTAARESRANGAFALSFAS